jgi:GTP cyclohydrolase III
MHKRLKTWGIRYYYARDTYIFVGRYDLLMEVKKGISEQSFKESKIEEENVLPVCYTFF